MQTWATQIALTSVGTNAELERLGAKRESSVERQLYKQDGQTQNRAVRQKVK